MSTEENFRKSAYILSC